MQSDVPKFVSKPAAGTERDENCNNFGYLLIFMQLALQLSCVEPFRKPVSTICLCFTGRFLTFEV